MELIKNYNRVDCAYEAPSVKMLDILAEGVLCASYKWTEGGAGIYTDEDINSNGEY